MLRTVHRGAAAICLAALIWFILATELAGVFSPKIDDEVEPNFKEKKKASNVSESIRYSRDWRA